MKKTFLLVSIIFFSFTFSDLLFAVSANPNPIEINQPDGTKITLKLKGDEFYSWFEDVNGYTVMKDPQTNFWCYAQKNNFGDLMPSKNVVGKTSVSSLDVKKSLKDDNRLFKAQQRRIEHSKDLHRSLAQFSSSKKSDLSDSPSKIQSAASASSATENKTNFVLLVQFKDLKFSDNPPFINLGEDEIRKKFEDLFNKSGYRFDDAVGSVKDYFKEVSYGALNYESVISPIITVDESYLDYAENKGEDISYKKVRTMIAEVLVKLDEQGYDFKKLWPNSDEPEGFTVIHAGGGAEAGNYNFIWSHKGTLPGVLKLDGISFSNYHTEPAGRGYNGDGGLVRIGTVCHESLHFFGLPDLYDTKYVTSGLGDFCIMAGGCWNGGDGKRPAHPCAWAKLALGWINPQTAVDGLNSIGTSAENKDAFYVFEPEDFDNEYFLMENRQFVGFDKGLPGKDGKKGGLLIYHIDNKLYYTTVYENKNSLVYNDHYLVLLEEAGSGTSNWLNFPLMQGPDVSGFSSDYFRDNTVSYFIDDCTSSPNGKSYSGKLSGIKITQISSSSKLMTFVYGKDIVIIDNDLSKIVCYPNPARDGVVNITNIPTVLQDFSAEIFTLSSKSVKFFSADDTELTEDGFRKISWDCKNNSGEDVAPGIYLLLVKNDSKKKVFKIAVIR